MTLGPRNEVDGVLKHALRLLKGGDDDFGDGEKGEEQEREPKLFACPSENGVPEGIDEEQSRHNPQHGINLQDCVPHTMERSMEYFDCGVPKNPYYRMRCRGSPDALGGRGSDQSVGTQYGICIHS